MKTLFAVTTFNQLDYTKKFVSSYKAITLPNVDLIFIDDFSKDGTQSYLKNQGFKLYERDKPKGLTWGWNFAYRIFKEKGYDCLIIANNDILINKRAIENLIHSTNKFSLVCPLTTKRGAGHNWQNQSVHIHYPHLLKLAENPSNYRKVQDGLSNKIIQMNKFNGFLFGLSRNIIESQWDDENLFNPSNVNIHQEGDLQSRMKEKPALCLGSFIYHFKGVSFHKKGIVNGKDIRQNLKIYHE